MSSLLDRLLSPSLPSFASALGEAVGAGEAGDTALAEILDRLPRDRRVVAVTALGDAAGRSGPGALRRILRNNAAVVLRCAAVLALSKRCGAAAAADLAADADGWPERPAWFPGSAYPEVARIQKATGDPIWLAMLRHCFCSPLVKKQDHSATLLDHWAPEVRLYTLLSLACVGDDRAWNQVFLRLDELARPRRLQHRQEIQATLCYLVPHVGEAGSERSTRLVDLLRSRWSSLDRKHQEWLSHYWPQSSPGGPTSERAAPPDAEAIREWVRHPLLDPLSNWTGLFDDELAPFLPDLEEIARERGIALQQLPPDGWKEATRLGEHYERLARLSHTRAGGMRFQSHHARSILLWVWEAIGVGASTVYIVPLARYISTRFRVDAGIYEYTASPRYHQRSFVACCKVMARLDPGEPSDFPAGSLSYYFPLFGDQHRRKTPDRFAATPEGRITLTFAGRPLDLRVAFRPPTDWEVVTIEILSRG